MSSLADIKRELSNTQQLERDLHLKQLQVNRLLNLTQAINNNVSSRGLFDMFTSFLSWEMGIKKLALYFKDNDQWVCKAFSGIPEGLIALDISDRLPEYNRLHNLDADDHLLLKEFDVVIPVLHKKSPLAYVFIGGFDEHEDMYNKVQFITTVTNIVAVAIENKRLFKRQLEQERLKKEMELASQMQRMLIPAELPSNDRFEFSSIYRPQLGVGGDYFDVIQFDDHRFAFCVGDISGKGVAAALLMANFQANFHSLIRKDYPLDAFIRALNESVIRITQGEKFITFFVAEFNTETRVLKYINAGHNPPILIHNDEVVLLRKGCTILGSFEELPQIEIGEDIIKGNATILAYTDGLTDLRNNDGDFLDTDMINGFTFQNSHLSAAAFNDKLMIVIKQFKDRQDFPDDFTILTCKIFE
ncbi:MAG: PP2C family protein-serine/threonine phosphatase [Bacteroidota bacterium]